MSTRSAGRPINPERFDLDLVPLKRLSERLELAAASDAYREKSGTVKRAATLTEDLIAEVKELADEKTRQTDKEAAPAH